MIYEAKCGYCEAHRYFSTAEKRSQWLDYHWADWDHDPENAFLRDISEPQSAVRRAQDRSDAIAATVRESIRKQREEKANE